MMPCFCGYRRLRRNATTSFLIGSVDMTCNPDGKRIEQIGSEVTGEIAFSTYFGGRAAIGPEAMNTRLDELNLLEQVRGEAIVAATCHIPGNRNAVQRVINLMAENRISAQSAEQRLMRGGWMRTLTSDDAAALLSEIAGPQLQNAQLVIDFLAMWVHLG